MIAIINPRGGWVFQGAQILMHNKFHACTTTSISNGTHVRNTLEPFLNTSLEHNMNKFSKSTTEEEFQTFKHCYNFKNSCNNIPKMPCFLISN